MDLWVVGIWRGTFFNEERREWHAWEFLGVFDSEEKAIYACKDERYFVGPAKLNEPFPDKTIPWPGSYYPITVGQT